MIEISRLFKEINGQVILKNINLTIAQGEILVILGASGAGKSVLLQHMIGLMKPDRGAVKIADADITRLSEKELLKIRKQIGYLFQEGALYDFMNVFENIAFPLREHTKLKEGEIEEKVRHILDMVGLAGEEEKFPAQLSGGMKKRAALARSVILNSKILFCDEPTSGLDPVLSRDISNLIRDISRHFQCTTVITSHDIPNSLRIADRLTLIHQGELLATGTRSQLENSKNPLVKEFIGQMREV